MKIFNEVLKSRQEDFMMNEEMWRRMSEEKIGWEFEEVRLVIFELQKKNNILLRNF